MAGCGTCSRSTATSSIRPGPRALQARQRAEGERAGEATIDPPAVADRIAARLGEIEGVAAVVLGGSRGRGTADANSDIDLGIYYHPSDPPAVEHLRALALELHADDSPPQVFGFGDWGPRENGGAWLRIEGHLVDWVYRDLARVSQVIDECSRGVVTCDYEVSHPQGFHNHIYLAELHHCRPLFDPSGVIARLKERIRTYPPRLQRALVAKFLFEAGFLLELAQVGASRGDVFYVSGCLFRAAAALVQVLFALNETYFMNEKGALEIADTFATRPPAFSARARAILAAPGQDPDSLGASLAQMAALLSETRALAEGVA